MFKQIRTWMKSAGEAAYKRRYTQRQKEIEAYLSQSVDRCDLERRIRELDRKGAYNSLY